MQTDSVDPQGAQALADGLSRQVLAWSSTLGADEASAALAARVARVVSQAVSEGHACVALADWIPEGIRAEQAVARLLTSRVVAALPVRVGPGGPSAVDANAAGGAACPLVLDPQGRVYLQRQFDLEQRLARALAPRLALEPGDGGELPLAAGQAADATGDSAQAAAVALALRRRFVIVSGGPGTGKTTTVGRVLFAHLQAHPGLRVALAAPTGKAAARMLESLRERTADWAPQLREALPAQAYTVHRLLGVTPRPGQFRHHAGNRLPVDLLVVDEASMLDLALAVRLLEALPAQARLIWLGDRDQLSAVESGAVFAELSAPGARSEAACARLTRNFRFTEGSGLGELADCIRKGDGAGSWERLERLETAREANPYWQEGYAPYVQAVRHAAAASGRGEVLDAGPLHRCLAGFRVLCGVRRGPFGLRAFQTATDAWLRQELGVGRSAWYLGRAVMVTQNDARLGLFNGDVGIAIPDGRGGLHLVFESAEGPRVVPIHLLPAHESALALTVHKAQGSEFDRVLLVLGDQPSAVHTREWVYTGATRARRELRVLADESVWRAAVARRVERRSGLMDRLGELSADDRGT